ncbi:HVO_A0114 family putative DNA-binding protein [Thauera chlorobenzoica]
MLKVLCEAGPVSIREAARRVGRDVKAVHGDFTARLNAGVLERTADGRIVFPFEAVKVEFLLQRHKPVERRDRPGNAAEHGVESGARALGADAELRPTIRTRRGVEYHAAPRCRPSPETGQ